MRLQPETVIELQLAPTIGTAHLRFKAKMNQETGGKLVIVDDEDGALTRVLRDAHLLGPTSEVNDDEKRISAALELVELQFEYALEPGELIWLYVPSRTHLLWDGVVRVMHVTIQGVRAPLSEPFQA